MSRAAKERIAELKALLAKATAGPWRLGGSGRTVEAMKIKEVCQYPYAIGKIDQRNLELIVALRNHAEELIAAAESAFDAGLELAERVLAGRSDELVKDRDEAAGHGDDEAARDLEAASIEANYCRDAIRRLREKT